jgi:hypothetical protein
VRDVSLRSVTRYLHFDKSEEEIDRLLQDWSDAPAADEAREPWAELREEAPWTPS